MSDDDFDAERFVDHAAALNGIRLAPEQRPGVIANFESFRALQLDWFLNKDVDTGCQIEPGKKALKEAINRH